jgi:hypothetical protein
MSYPLRYECEGLRSARRGDYRVLFCLDEDAHMLQAMRIARRGLHLPLTPRGTVVNRPGTTAQKCVER